MKFEKMTKIRVKKIWGYSIFFWRISRFFEKFEKKSGGIQNFVDSLIEIFKSLGGGDAKKVQIFICSKKCKSLGGGGIIFEIAINFTKEIPLKNVGWFQKFGGNTLVNRVQFDGWTVGWLDGKLFFEYTPDRSGPKTRATQGQASLRSEILENRLERGS